MYPTHLMSNGGRFIRIGRRCRSFHRHRSDWDWRRRHDPVSYTTRSRCHFSRVSLPFGPSAAVETVAALSTFQTEHTGFCLASQSRYEPQYVLWLCLLVAWSQCQSRMTFPEVCVFVFMCACFSSTSLPLQPLPLFCQRWFVFVLFLSPLPRSLSPSKLFSCVSEEATTLAHAQF